MNTSEDANNESFVGLKTGADVHTSNVFPEQESQIL